MPEANKKVVQYLFLLFLVLVLLGIVTLDFYVLLLSVAMTLPYVILSQILIPYLAKTGLGAFTIAILIAALCLTSYAILSVWIDSPRTVNMFRVKLHHVQGR
jgi:hypothetical protein